MPTIRLAAILALSLLTGCGGATAYNSGVAGPTGRASDSGKVSSITVHDTWKVSLQQLSLDLVRKKLRFPDTAKFDHNVHFEGFYDVGADMTRVGVWSNVSCSSPYGTTIKNGYYVTWELPGKITSDFPPPWELADVEIFDQQY